MNQQTITMPQTGEGVIEATIIAWLKDVGDSIQQDEPLIEVETDKVTFEVVAEHSGTLKEQRAHEGETIPVGGVLGVIETETESDSTPPSVAAEKASAARQSQPPRVSPLVARMAAEHELDLSQIQGTGRGGRITKHDVQAYLEQSTVSPRTASAPQHPRRDYTPDQPAEAEISPRTEQQIGTPQAQSRQPRPTPPAPPDADPKVEASDDLLEATKMSQFRGEEQTASTMRRRIAEHMVRSKLHTSPHATTIFEADLSAIVKHRAAHKDAYAREGIKLTFTPYFVGASAYALLHHLPINSRWIEKTTGEPSIYTHHVAHIGVAVAIPDGLLVPVIHNAQDYNLKGLTRQVNELSERARTGRLKPHELRDGTFTITNHGVNGSLAATPIIHQPQAAILGVGTIEKRVKVIDDAIAIRPCAYLSLTFDHRLVDGAVADAFMTTLVQQLENWPT